MTDLSGLTLRDIRSLAIKGLDHVRSRLDGQGTAQHFTTNHYQRHNQRRLEHLASLGLPLQDRTVLEVGAGIGDHTTFFLDRGCTVVSSDARLENVELLRARFPSQEVLVLDLERPPMGLGRKFDIVYCYGLLYHLACPVEAITFMSEHSSDLLLLETCVSYGSEHEINLCAEVSTDPTQAFSGTGCRPTRPWIFAELRKHFQHVYMPITQPSHEQFPLDWTQRPSGDGLTRSVFIASRAPIDNPLLTATVPMQQRRS